MLHLDLNMSLSWQRLRRCRWMCAHRSALPLALLEALPSSIAIACPLHRPESGVMCGPVGRWRPASNGRAWRICNCAAFTWRKPCPTPDWTHAESCAAIASSLALPETRRLLRELTD
jgi:hypothetical protein